MGSNSIFLICIAGVLVLSSVVHSQDVRGTPGFDYPNYDSIPETSFKCSEQRFIPGFYADLETRCQAFHFCFKDNQESFLCPAGTTFNQQKLMCDVWLSSNCSLAPMYYGVNSGPAMKNAAKKLPMFLKLRNRSQGKLSVQSSTAVYEKMASLFENSNAVSVGEEHKSMHGNSEQVNIAENAEAAQETVAEVEQAQFGSSKVADGEISLQNEDHEGIVEEQDLISLAYDPIDTDGFDRYDTNDGYEEMQSDANYGSEADFLRRHFQPDQLAERVRRRPTYVVVPEDDDEPIHNPGMSRGIRSPNENQSSGSATGLSTDANATYEWPFSGQVLIPLSTMTPPMSSEDFERAIIEELVIPGMSEEERANFTGQFPEPEASSEEFQKDSDTQSEQFYTDPLTGYETDETMYGWRRPTYVVVEDEDESQSSRPQRSPDESDTLEAETQQPELFPLPTRIPYHLREYSTEVPVSSEEFEREIMDEFVIPDMSEAELYEGRILASTNPEHVSLTTRLPESAASYQESQTASDTQGDQFVYIDPLTGYETDRIVYDWSPVYDVDQDGGEYLKFGRPRRSPDEPETSETEASSAEPFPRPTRIPYHLRQYSTNEPISSEDFERAIIEDLVNPGQTEAELNEGRILASTYPEHANLTTPFPQSAASYEESQGDSNMQGDEFVYVDDEMEGYETDKTMHDWRRPMYTLVQSGDQHMKPGRPRRSPGEPRTSETETSRPEPFPRPTRIPYHLREYSTSEPISSEDFERAIIEDLVNPGQTEAELGEGRILASTYPEHANLTTPFPESAAYEESQTGSDMQNDQFQFVDMASNMNHEYENAENLQMDMRDKNLYSDEYRYYDSRFESPQFQGFRPYPGRWPEPIPYYPGMRPGFPVRVPYLSEKAPLTAEIPQMNTMTLGQYIDQRSDYSGLSAYQRYRPLNYEPEAPFAYGDQYSVPFVPISEGELPYSYGSEYPVIEETDSDSLGLQMENEILVTSPLPITDSDLLEPTAQTDFDEEIPEEDEQSEETYYVFDFDEDEQSSELNANGDEVAGTDENSADSSELQVNNDQSLNSETSQNNLKSNFSEHSSKIAGFSTTDSKKPVSSSSTLERLATKATGSSVVSSNSGFDANANLNKVVFPESMDFGPYGFGANMGQQYGMIDSFHGSTSGDKLLQRKGDGGSNLDKLSALQERIRSMKQGKFGVFKKYLSSSKEKK